METLKVAYMANTRRMSLCGYRGTDTSIKSHPVGFVLYTMEDDRSFFTPLVELGYLNLHLVHNMVEVG